MENEKLILNKLNLLAAQIAYIREHIEDITLNHDDINSVREAKKDLKAGKTKRL